MGEQKIAAPNITQMLREWGDGRHEALDELLPHIYAELHRQAARAVAPRAAKPQPSNHGARP